MISEISADLISLFRKYVDEPLSRLERNTEFIHPLSEARSPAPEMPPYKNIASIADKPLSEYVNAVLRGQPANPNRADIVQKLNAAYADTALTTPQGPTSFKQVTEALQHLLSDCDYVALVGARGVGKTALINKWLNEATRSYLESNARLAWFRVDATKLYELKRNTKFDDSLTTLENYFKIHSVYVFLTYSGVFQTPNSVHSLSPLFVASRDEVESELKKRDLLGEMLAYYDPRAAGQKELLSENVIFNLFRRHRFPKAFESFLAAWNVISDVLQKRNIGILTIIDGLDNISWTKHNALYQAACRETVVLLEDVEAITRNSRNKVLLVARPETMPEIQALLLPPGYNDGSGSLIKKKVDFGYVSIAAPDATKIVQAKNQAAQNVTVFESEYLRARQQIESLQSEDSDVPAFEQLLSEFRTQTLRYSAVMAHELNGVLKGGGADFPGLGANEVLSHLFDNNIRAFLDCCSRAYRGRRLSEEIHIQGASSDRRVLEYTLLGDAVYLDSTPRGQKTRYAQIPRGRVFPNIFWYDYEDALDDHAVWHGLAGLRILQLFANRKMICGDGMHLLQELFGYSQGVLTEHVEAFVAFGLLEVDARAISSVKYGSKESWYAGYTNIVHTSKKGQLIMNLPFRYVDYLYVLALDTPLHASAVRNTKLVRFYRDPLNLNFVYNFFDASIPTLVTFARHLVHYQREEQDKILTNLDRIGKEYSGLIHDLGVLQDWFSLPPQFVDHLLGSLKDMLAARRRRPVGREYTYSDLEADLYGGFSK